MVFWKKERKFRNPGGGVAHVEISWKAARSRGERRMQYAHALRSTEEDSAQCSDEVSLLPAVAQTLGPLVGLGVLKGMGTQKSRHDAKGASVLARHTANMRACACVSKQ
jgi:hypothetical protein